VDVCECLFGVQIWNVDTAEFFGPCARACGNVHIEPAEGNPCANIGDIMVLHCFGVNVVAGSGYTSFCMITFRRLKLLFHRPSREFFILRCHVFAMSTRYANSVSMLPSGTSWTPSVR